VTSSSRKVLLATAACAVAITAFAFVGLRTDRRSTLAGVATLLVFGGATIAVFVGRGQGAHGMPNEQDVEPYLFTFLLWWGVLYALYRWRMRRRAARHRGHSG
jgi:hypothetical protein